MEAMTASLAPVPAVAQRPERRGNRGGASSGKSAPLWRTRVRRPSSIQWLNHSLIAHPPLVDIGVVLGFQAQTLAELRCGR